MVSVAISVGISLAASLVTSILTPKPKAEPGLDDLSILKSEYGVPLPKTYGVTKLTGNVIWGLDIIEREESSGGKGGGGATQFNYYGTFAVAICEGEIHAISRIWLNNKLYMFADGTLGSTPGNSTLPFGLDAYSDDPNLANDSFNSLKESERLKDKVTVYLGTNTQNPDPIIEAEEGVGNTPAFRNYVYIVFNDIPLAEYGNVIPKVDVEVVTKNGDTSIAEVLVDLCGRAGIPPSQVDVTQVVGNMRGGYMMQGGDSPRDLIESIQRVYSLISYESNGTIFFTPLERDLGDVITFTQEDLGAREESEDAPNLYTEKRVQNIELPSQLDIEYRNAFNQYDPGTQTTFKSTAIHTNEVSFRSNLTLADSEAKLACTKNLEYFWTQRFKYEGIRLSTEHIGIRPGDLIQFPVRGTSVIAQVEKVNVGSNTLVEIDAYTYSDRVNNIPEPNIPNNTYTPPQFVNFAGQPDVSVIETNKLNDADDDIGVYGLPIADPDSDGWTGGTIVIDRGNTGNFESLVGTSLSARYGELDSIIRNTKTPGVTDRGARIQVTMLQGQLNSIPDVNFYNLENLIYIDGELIAFQNATLIGTNTYELSNLIRGVKGTESFVKQHSTNTRFFLVGNYLNAPGTPEDIGTDIVFKAVPQGVAETEVIESELITVTGQRAKPFSPTFVKLVKDTNGDILISWQRRTRFQGQWLTSTETVPVNESILQFNLIIYSNTSFTTVVRAVQVSSSTSYNYTSAQQIADFGSERTTLNLRVNQISALGLEGFNEDLVNRRMNEIR